MAKTPSMARIQPADHTQDTGSRLQSSIQETTQTPPKKVLLSITNLKKYFPVAKSSFFAKQMYVRANEDISIDIYQGETFGLVGESGCGKSTLGRVLLQLYAQTAGSTMYYGRSLEEVAPRYVLETLSKAEKYVEK